MSKRARDLIPFVQVAEVDRSIAFYELLGFCVGDTHMHAGKLDWAALESDAAQIMLTSAGGPIDPSEQRVLFYVYVEDLDALRKHLIENRVTVGPIVDGRPGPDREMGLRDPDGYCLMVAEID